jgi:WD40 repeat protein
MTTTSAKHLKAMVPLSGTLPSVLTGTLLVHASSVSSTDPKASVGEDKRLLIWECKIAANEKDEGSTVYKGKYVWKLVQTIANAHGRSIYAVDWSKDNVIATGCADNAVRIFVQV